MGFMLRLICFGVITCAVTGQVTGLRIPASLAFAALGSLSPSPRQPERQSSNMFSGQNLNPNQLNGLMSQLRNRMLQRMLLSSQQNRANSVMNNNIVEPTPQFGSSGGLSNLASALSNMRRRQDINAAQLNNRIAPKEQPSSVIQWQAAGQSRSQVDSTTPPATGNSGQSSIRISMTRKNDVKKALDTKSSFVPQPRQVQNTPKNVKPVSASFAQLLRNLGRNGVSSAMQNRGAQVPPAPRSRSLPVSNGASRITSSATLTSMAAAGAMRGQMSEMLDTQLDVMSDMAEAGMFGMPGMMGMPGMGMPGMSRFGMSRGVGGLNMLPFS